MNLREMEILICIFHLTLSVSQELQGSNITVLTSFFRGPLHVNQLAMMRSYPLTACFTLAVMSAHNYCVTWHNTKRYNDKLQIDFWCHLLQRFLGLNSITTPNSQSVLDPSLKNVA